MSSAVCFRRCALCFVQPNGWSQTEHDARIAGAVKACGSTTPQLMRWYLPWYNNPAAESQYAKYLLNETRGTSFCVGMMTIFMMSMYLSTDVNDPDTQNKATRIILRSSSLGVLLLAALVVTLCPALNTRLGLWLRWMAYVSVGTLIHLRAYYEPDEDSYIRSAAIWSIGMKAVCICVDVGVIRTGTFVVFDFVSNAVMESARPSIEGNPVPSRWDICMLLLFLVACYFADLQYRQSFSIKCSLYLARVAAEEAAMLHKFLADNTLDMICVHEFCVNPSSPEAAKGSLENGRIKYVSASCHRILGWPASAMLGQMMTMYVHPQDMQHALQMYAGLLIDEPVDQRTITTGSGGSDSRLLGSQASPPGAAAVTSGIIKDGWTADLRAAVTSRVAADSLPTIGVSSPKIGIAPPLAGGTVQKLFSHISSITSTNGTVLSPVAKSVELTNLDPAAVSPVSPSPVTGWAAASEIGSPVPGDAHDVNLSFAQRLKHYQSPGIDPTSVTTAPNVLPVETAARAPSSTFIPMDGAAGSDSEASQQLVSDRWTRHKLRLRHAAGHFVELEVTANLTTQGLACVYRPATN